MSAFYAVTPLLIVLLTMLLFRWSSSRAGLAGLLLAVIVGWLHFGLTLDVLWVSQVRGLALAFYVLYIIWPALFLYNFVHALGGIERLQLWLQATIKDPSELALLLAWSLSGVLEGIAGFGVPLAVVSPIIVSLGFDPVTAVASTAIGHAWSVTFGDMGVVFEALITVVKVPGASVAAVAAILLGVICICSGLAVAWMLGVRRQWHRVLLLGFAMSIVQGAAPVFELTPLAAFSAGLAGLGLGIALFRVVPGDSNAIRMGPVLKSMLPYGITTALLAVLAFLPELSSFLSVLRTAMWLPKVTTNTGWSTPAGATKSIAWMTHPGTVMLLSVMLSCFFYRYLQEKGDVTGALKVSGKRTVAFASKMSLGLVIMMGLAMIMDHTGMIQSVAESLSSLFGGAYPVISAFIGTLGAFTTGSNTNSNVLLGPLQLEVARLLALDSSWLLASQTTGGALGSMIAPAKLIVGCAAVGIAGQEGRVLRQTLIMALILGLLAGMIAWIIA